MTSALLDASLTSAWTSSRTDIEAECRQCRENAVPTHGLSSPSTIERVLNALTSEPLPSSPMPLSVGRRETPAQGRLLRPLTELFGVRDASVWSGFRREDRCAEPCLRSYVPRAQCVDVLERRSDRGGCIRRQCQGARHRSRFLGSGPGHGEEDQELRGVCRAGDLTRKQAVRIVAEVQAGQAARFRAP